MSGILDSLPDYGSTEAPKTPTSVLDSLPDYDGGGATSGKSYSGKLLPFTKDEAGNVSFDSNAGIVGAIKRAVTLPADVITGKVQLPSSEGIPGSIGPNDPGANDAYNRVGEAAAVLTPGVPGVATGAAVGGKSAIDAAKTAVELGAPLPRGMATENAGVHAITQGARSLPYVGQKIDERLAATAGAAGDKLAEGVQELTGGITSRADVGESMRLPLSEAVTSNKNTIDSSFNSLRSAIDPEAAQTPRNLGEAMIQIGRSRQGSGWDNPGSGLDNLVNLVRKGASFNDLQRARSELAETMDFGAPHGGFTAGDKKLLLGAMTKDMEGAVRATAKIPTDEALGLLSSANKTFQDLSAENKNFSGVLNSQRDTLVAGKLVNAANGKTGDPKLLASLKSKIPEEDFNRVAGSVLGELGKNQSGEFSLQMFSKGWSQLGDRQKNILFGQRKQFYDDIAHLSSFVKGSEQYKNTSGTGRAATIATVISTLATGVATAVGTGSMLPLAAPAAAIAGGYALAKALASPAGAASVARMSRAAQNYTKAPSAATRATLMITARDAGKTLDGLGSSGLDLLRQLKTPVNAEPETQQQ